jgi:hypothetical protein
MKSSSETTTVRVAIDVRGGASLENAPDQDGRREKSEQE